MDGDNRGSKGYISLGVLAEGRMTSSVLRARGGDGSGWQGR